MNLSLAAPRSDGATDANRIAELAEGHDAVASALGPSEDQDPGVLLEMVEAVVEGLREAGVDRLVWTGGAGSLNVDEDGESYVSMEDFAIAFVDELEDGEAIHSRLGVGY